MDGAAVAAVAGVADAAGQVVSPSPTAIVFDGFGDPTGHTPPMARRQLNGGGGGGSPGSISRGLSFFCSRAKLQPVSGAGFVRSGLSSSQLSSTAAAAAGAQHADVASPRNRGSGSDSPTELCHSPTRMRRRSLSAGNLQALAPLGRTFFRADLDHREGAQSAAGVSDLDRLWIREAEARDVAPFGRGSSVIFGTAGAAGASGGATGATGTGAASTAGAGVGVALGAAAAAAAAASLGGSGGGGSHVRQRSKEKMPVVMPAALPDRRNGGGSSRSSPLQPPVPPPPSAFAAGRTALAPVTLPSPTTAAPGPLSLPTPTSSHIHAGSSGAASPATGGMHQPLTSSPLLGGGERFDGGGGCGGGGCGGGGAHSFTAGSPFGGRLGSLAAAYDLSDDAAGSSCHSGHYFSASAFNPSGALPLRCCCAAAALLLRCCCAALPCPPLARPPLLA